jgi:hypothetical protein
MTTSQGSNDARLEGDQRIPDLPVAIACNGLTKRFGRDLLLAEPLRRTTATAVHMTVLALVCFTMA